MQKRLFNKATNPFYRVDFEKLMSSIKIVSYNVPDDDKTLDEGAKKLQKEMSDSLRKFELSLPAYRRHFFRREIKPYLDARGSIKDPLERFDTGLAQRWVFNKVVDLGWKYELHGEFDSSLSYQRADRSDHKAERLGKKYQWIALHELLARISDNFEFKEGSWSDESEKYEGSWQLSTRDIDPSCILKDNPNIPPNGLPTFKNHKPDHYYNAWSKKSSHSTWLRKTNDLPSPKLILELTDSNDTQWIALEGFIKWQEATPPEQKKYDVETRTLGYTTKSYLVKKKNKVKTIKWLAKLSFKEDLMPESHEFYNVYLAEYPWSPAFLNLYVPYFQHDGWTNRARRNQKIPSKILVTDDEYISSGNSRDCSSNEAITVKLPAKYIIDEMNLTQDFVDGRFFDSSGDLVAFDPSLFASNVPRHIYIRKDRFVSFLNSRDYSIIWIVLGEKNLIGGGMLGQPQGRLEINGVYTLTNDRIAGSLKTSFLTAQI